MFPLLRMEAGKGKKQEIDGFFQLPASILTIENIYHLVGTTAPVVPTTYRRQMLSNTGIIQRADCRPLPKIISL